MEDQQALTLTLDLTLTLYLTLFCFSGSHGHRTAIKMVAWGAWDRTSGLCVLEDFKKLKPDGTFREGPAKASEVMPFIEKHIQAPCKIMSDGLLAYRNTLTEMGFEHQSVNHSAGEFVREADHSIHTNTIEGKWGDLKNALRGMRGLRRAYQPYFLRESMWRHNIKIQGEDAFEFIFVCLGCAYRH